MIAQRRPWDRPLRLVLVATAAGAALWMLGPALPLPRGTTSSQLDAWLRHEGVASAVFAVMRIVALATAAYAALVGALGVLGSMSRAATLTRVAVRIAVPSLRPFVAPIAAVTLTLASALPAAAQGRGAPPPVPVMRVVPIEATTGAPPIMRLVTETTEATEAPPELSSMTHTVVAGDTFWSIAEDTLQAHAGTVAAADVVSYWHALIDANRPRLRAPDAPDLIYPGQVFVLPPVT